MAATDRVDSWFGDFTIYLMDVVRLGNWPEGGDEYWATLRKMLVLTGANAALAREAAQSLAMDGGVFLGDVIPKLKEYVGQLRKLAAMTVQTEDGTRDSAEHASRDCEDCGGNGFAIRYRHESMAPGLAPSVAFYCLCVLGRWLENAHRTAKEEPSRQAHRRIPDLADHLDLQMRPVPWSPYPDHRCRYPLNQWDAANGRPAAAPAPFQRATVKDLLKRASA